LDFFQSAEVTVYILKMQYGMHLSLDVRLLKVIV